jgi:CBS domain-containing protein
MRVGELCSREVVFIGRNESVADAARLMRQHHIGSLVVADKNDGRLVPGGMITDRDVAVGVVALGLDAEKTPVEAAMRAQVSCVACSRRSAAAPRRADLRACGGGAARSAP